MNPTLLPPCDTDMLPARRTQNGPRACVSVRVYPEYRAALNEFTFFSQVAGKTAFQRYEVLEFLMAELITDAGRRGVVRRIAEQPHAHQQNKPRTPRVMLAARIRPEYMRGLQLALDAALDIDLTTLERYHVLEYVLAPLLSDAGQQRTLDALLRLSAR